MVTFLLYIVKSTCCLTLFYLGYKALLSNETFFRFNRMVLLAGMLVCMLLPFVELRTESPGVLQMPLLQLEEMIQEGVGETVSQHSVVQVGTEVVPAVREASGSWGEWAVYLYLVGMAVVLCRLVRSFVMFALADPERREDTERALYAGAGRAGRSLLLTGDRILSCR